ncbi:MAG: hypothetical protein IPK82_27925 [Polyangiaceae bacterium]|nr:hypothetical protein [Polyangiaceae bacterium]
MPVVITRWNAARLVRLLGWGAVGLSLGVGACLSDDEGDLTEPPDASHCPAETPDYCGSVCVDTQTDLSHCGACGAACVPGSQGVEVACDAGTCKVTECEPTFADCDGLAENGCEVDTTRSAAHCGTCGNACSTQCLAGECNDVVEVSAGAQFTCAVRKSGSVWCWGDNTWENLGAGESLLPGENLSPVKVKLDADAEHVAVNQNNDRKHACAVLKDGGLVCWGANGNGQIGLGDTKLTAVPAPVGLADVAAVAPGGRHTCAITQSLKLYCWGNNFDGQVGTGDGMPDHWTPQEVKTSAQQVVSGRKHSCARFLNASVQCWGSNALGQVGNGSATETYPTPVPISFSGGFSLLSSGLDHTCAVDSGKILCWGSNAQGQVGLAPGMPVLTPNELGVTEMSELALGTQSSVALGRSGIWGWGDNTSGQLGLGNTGPVSTPTPTLAGLGKVAQLAMGLDHACALMASGALLCWGNNDAGQLGVGNKTSSTQPVAVAFPPEGI